MAVKKDVAPDLRRQATRIGAGTLAGALKDVIGVVSGRDTIPILSHVRIEAEGAGDLPALLQVIMPVRV